MRMALSSVLLKMKNGQEEGVRSCLAKIPGVSVETAAPSGELIVIVEADSIHDLHKQCMDIERLEGVLGVYPSYVTMEDELQMEKK
jgi:nitrate reductase NapD